MEFTYTKQLRTKYHETCDEWDYEEVNAHYEPSDDEILMALAEIVNDDFFKSDRLDLVRLFIKEYDLIESLSEEYKDELHDYFEPYAWGRK